MRNGESDTTQHPGGRFLVVFCCADRKVIRVFPGYSANVILGGLRGSVGWLGGYSLFLFTLTLFSPLLSTCLCFSCLDYFSGPQGEQGERSR